MSSNSNNNNSQSGCATPVTMNNESKRPNCTNTSNNSTAKIVITNSARKEVITIKPKIKRRVTELRCGEIRWFFRRKEDTKWTPFKGYDSVVLEVAFRQAKDLPFDEPIKEHLSSLPQNVIVMDGNYKADEQLENIEAIYWKEDTFQIRRGTWFYADTMQPLPADFSDAIEAHHLKCFKDNVIPETPVFSEYESSKKPELTTIKWAEEKVCWNSVVDVHIAPQKSNVVVRFLTRSKGPVPLRRGFGEEANPEEGKPSFSDLILVVHGIGQKGYENLIAKNTAQIREAIHQQMDKYYPNEKRRPAILPIEWRASLLLDNGVTDECTLPKMPQARSTLNSVCMDLMYYQSPLYRTEIVNGVIKSLNSVHSTFMANNPDFCGPISIVGHSLGSVIAYDVLTNWSPFLLYDHFVTNAIAEQIMTSSSAEQKHLLEQFYNSRKQMLEVGGLMEQILVRQEEPLKFKVKFLFCLGSPLAIFCIMRGCDYRSVIPRPDQVERVFNIFHPYDPVAYRLEPMFHENYKHIRPLKLFNYTDAIKSYENAIFECHRSYLKKCKSRSKKEKEKEAASAKEKKAKEGSSNGNGKAKNGAGNKSKEGGTSAPIATITDEEEEQHHFMDDSDSDLEVGSSTYTPSTPRSMTPQNAGGTVAATAAALGLSTVPAVVETPPTALATPTTPLASGTGPLGKLEGKKEAEGNADKNNELGTSNTNGDLPEQGVEAAEEGEENDDGEGQAGCNGEDEEEALPAGDDSGPPLMKTSPLDDLKSMGEAGRLIEQIPPGRRIGQRIDFQVQPWMLDKSYWSMLKSHFSYWANLDVAAFLLNAIYPPPLEVIGVVKP